MYTIKRHILPILERRFRNNIVLSLSGARQVGKSTLCNYLFKDVKKINFDNKLLRSMALDDEIGFLNKQNIPLQLDGAIISTSLAIYKLYKDFVLSLLSFNPASVK